MAQITQHSVSEQCADLHCSTAASYLKILQATPSFRSHMAATLCVVQALVSNGGYTYLDVRPAIELEQVGKVNGVNMVNIPVMNGGSRWSSEKRKKVSTYPDQYFTVQ